MSYSHRNVFEALIEPLNSGHSARLISKYRPICPIIMVTRNATAARVSISRRSHSHSQRALIQAHQYSHLYRGVYPFVYPEKKPDFKQTDWQEDVDGRLSWGIKEAIKLGVLNKGDNVVCVQGWRGGKGHTNTLRIVPAEEDLGLSQE